MISFSFSSFLIVSFLGGTLSLFSPCSGAILPTYFAYAFNTKRRLLLATFIFFLGLVITAVPLGIGVTVLANVVFSYGRTLYKAIGVLFIVLGILIFTGRSVLPSMKSSVKSKNKFVSIFSLGIFSGLAIGTCSGPVLGAIATLAGLSGSYAKAGVMMFFYTLGIVAPLFVFSIFIDRFNMIKRFFANETYLNAFSGSLFIILGVFFIYYNGSIGGIPYISKSVFLERSFDLQDKLFILFNKWEVTK